VRKFVHNNGWPLFQQQVHSDWELLVGAILLNQSKRTPAWDTTFAKILYSFPTPKKLSGAGEKLEEFIKPHGFANTKAKRLRRMSAEYLEWDGVDPRDLYGCGQYAWDSWRIFMKGERPRPEDVKDGALCRFLEKHWVGHEGH
jgi:adenine-specific DNA glycosylase